MNPQEILFNKWLILSGKIVMLFMVLPIVMSIIKKDILDKSLKIFSLHCTVALLAAFLLNLFVWIIDNYTTYWLPYLNKWNIHDTNFMGILSHLNHFGLLGWYFFLVIPNKKMANGIKWVSILLFFATLINYLFIEGFRVYGVFNPTASAIYCFTLPLLHVWYLFHDDTIVPLTKNPYFWFALGLLIPNMIGFFLHFAGDKIYGEDFILFCKISIGKSVFSIMGQIFLAIGFYYAHYTQYMRRKTE